MSEELHPGWTGKPYESDFQSTWGLIKRNKMFNFRSELCEDDNVLCAAQEGFQYIILPTESELGTRLYRTSYPPTCINTALVRSRKNNARQRERYIKDLDYRATVLVGGARKRHAVCDLDPTNIADRMRKGFCEATGCPLDLENLGRARTPSLDRIDPKKGYTRDNVQVVCAAFNYMKHDYPDDDVGLFVGHLRSPECWAFR